MRAVAPAVKRRSSSLLKQVASATANAVAAGSPGAGTVAGVGAAGGGEHRRTRLLNVAMRSKTAAAAVEGSNYEDEVGPSPASVRLYFGVFSCVCFPCSACACRSSPIGAPARLHLCWSKPRARVMCWRGVNTERTTGYRLVARPEKRKEAPHCSALLFVSAVAAAVDS